MTFRRLILLQSLSIMLEIFTFLYLNHSDLSPLKSVAQSGGVGREGHQPWGSSWSVCKVKCHGSAQHRSITPKCDSLPCRKGKCSSFSHTNSEYLSLFSHQLRVFVPCRFWHDERYLRDRLLPERWEGFAACALDVPGIAEGWSLHHALRRLVTKQGSEKLL